MWSFWSYTVHAIFTVLVCRVQLWHSFRCHLFQFVTSWLHWATWIWSRLSLILPSALVKNHFSDEQRLDARADLSVMLMCFVSSTVLSYLCLNWVWAPAATQTETEGAKWWHVFKKQQFHIKWSAKCAIHDD